MEFLIDRKFWNKVIKKLPATSGAWIKRNLSEWHTKVETKYIKKKVENPHYMPRFGKSSPWDEPKYFVRDVPKSKTIKVGKYLKTDFVLNLPKTKIREGFLYKKCFAYEPLKRINHIPIEKVIIKILIQDYGFNETVLYEGEPVIQLEHNYLKDVIKGFVYLIRNEDIFKIGVTDNLLRRFNQLKPDEVLNVVRCSNYESLEKELHKKFKKNRIPQTEYFRLNKNQIEEVNIAMTKGADF